MPLAKFLAIIANFLVGKLTQRRHKLLLIFTNNLAKSAKYLAKKYKKLAKHANFEFVNWIALQFFAIKLATLPEIWECLQTCLQHVPKNL